MTREATDANHILTRGTQIWLSGDYHKIAVEHQIVSERLVVEANVRANQRVLDVACGTGNTAIAAARRRANVTAIDLAPDLIERAKLRSSAEGIEGIRYQVGDASTLPYPDESFDAVLSTLGVNFFPDHKLTIDELLRVTAPGGTIGLAIWSEAGLPGDFYKLGVEYGISPSIDETPPAYGEALRRCIAPLGNGDHLAQLIDGRATSVRIVPSHYEACYPSIDDFISLYAQAHGPTIARLSALGDDARRHRYRDDMATILARYNRATDGTFACSFDYLQVVIVKR